MVSFVSSNFNNSHWSDPKVLLPFEQGINNIKVAFAPSQPQNSMSLNMRVVHFAVGVVLSIPVVNTIVALTIKFFSPKTSQQQPAPQNSQSSMSPTITSSSPTPSTPSSPPVPQENPEHKTPQWYLDLVGDSGNGALASLTATVSNDTQHTFENKNFYGLADWNKDFVQNLKANNRSGWKANLKSLFESTRRMYEMGQYDLTTGENVRLNRNLHQNMITNTRLYEPAPLNSLPQNGTYNTVFEVIEEDTFELAKRYRNEGFNPVGLNMANAKTPGGGVLNGARAQEECLCRRSDYYAALEKSKKKNPNYLMEGMGHIIYTPDIQVFRSKEVDVKGGDTGLSYELIKPYSVSMIACAALYLKPGASLPPRFEENTKQKIRSILRAVVDNNHDSLVLGALGCGAFSNPPDLVAGYFKEIFDEPEFNGRFKKVGFGILYDKNLLSTFKSILT